MDNEVQAGSMPAGQTTGTATEFPLTDLIQKLRTMKEGMFYFRRRRHPDWSDNYALYRDKVQLNRLTQRQSVNVPLIKTVVKTLLKDIDDPPILYFTNLDNNDQAEVFANEYWKQQAIWNKLILKDIVDKRQVLLFGRSFKSLNLVNGRFSWTVDDPQDWLVDRYIDPSDIDSARGLCHQHIYLPLSSLRTDPKLDNNEVKRLQEFLGSKMGLVKAEENQLDYVEKNRRLMELGVIDVMSPILGETYVELNNFFIKEFNPHTKEDEIRIVITAEDMVTLFNQPLEKVIGETPDHFWQSHFPVVTWGDEAERTDFWSDGVVDALRTPNKILNSWFSQLVENRTLRNFGMNYFNSSLTEEGFTPQTFTPEPWGFYPIPAGEKALGDQIMHIDIPELKDSLEEMNFIMQIAQQASAATTFQQGVQGDKTITLGEVQLLLANAEKRVKSMAIYYTDAWVDFGQKFIKMLEASPGSYRDEMIHKKGRVTKKIFSKVISPKEFMTKSGYSVEVKMKSDAMAADADSLQKLNYAKSLMPNNKTLSTVIKRKSLDFADLPANDISEVMKEEEAFQKQLAANPQMASMMGGGAPMGGQPNGQPNGNPSLQLPPGPQGGRQPMQGPTAPIQ